jgi:hypothetical protein
MPVGQRHSWTGVLGIFGKRRVAPASTINWWEESFRAGAPLHETRNLNKPDGMAGGLV